MYYIILNTVDIGMNKLQTTAGAQYTKSIASLELCHKEHNNDSFSLHNNTIEETIEHILTWYIKHHPKLMTYSILSDEFSNVLMPSRGDICRLFFCTGFTAVDWRNNCLLPTNWSTSDLSIQITRTRISHRSEIWHRQNTMKKFRSKIY